MSAECKKYVVEGVTLVRDSFGSLHCTDGPAVFDGKGYEEWYVGGRRHRENGPAVVKPSHVYGKYREEWWLNGRRHRDGDLPALIVGEEKDKTWERCWYKNGLQHRENGPARITKGYNEENDDLVSHEWLYNDKWMQRENNLPNQYFTDGKEQYGATRFSSDPTFYELYMPTFEPSVRFVRNWIGGLPLYVRTVCKKYYAAVVGTWRPQCSSAELSDFAEPVPVLLADKKQN